MALLTVGELIDRSWEHYRREFVDLMSVSGWILLVALVNIIALAIYPSASKIIGDATLTSSEAFGVGLYAFANWVLAPLLGLWIFIVLVRLARSQLSGRRGAVREAMADGTRYFFPTLLVSLLIFLILAGALLIGFGPAVVLSLIAGAAANGTLSVLASLSLVVGMVAAIVLGFRWSVHYYFAPYALLIDDVRGRATLPASRKAVEGRFWGVFLRLVVPKLVFALLGVMAMAVVAFVFSLATGALAGLNLDVQLRLSTISTTVLSTVVAALLNPIIVVADLMLYQSLKR